LWRAGPNGTGEKNGKIKSVGFKPDRMLNMAEIELSALNGQCLDRRIPDLETLRSSIAAWENDRNNRQANINWRFSTADARIKLKHLYPKL
jgi:hypothetical protein